MRTEIKLGIASTDYDSRRGRGDLINGYVETNAAGDFIRVRKSPGLKEFANVGNGPIRGVFSIQSRLFVASGNELYLITNNSETLLGDIGGNTELVNFAANGTDDNQIIVISNKKGYIYDDTLGFRLITDPDFDPDYSVASLNQIFWVNKASSNEFQGSDIANGDSWPALRFGSAEQSPDPVQYVAQKRSALWFLGTRTCEYWQTDSADINLPVRPVLGATLERGVGAKFSVAEWQDSIFFLADDFSVWVIEGTAFRKISDIALEYAIKGDGFKEGYITPERAEGFFIDHPSHKLYVLTFKASKVTWIFDITTNLWHKRSSNDLGFWRGRTSTLGFNKILVGDALDGRIWELDENTFDEGGEPLKFQMTTPPVSADQADIFISYVEPNIEVGVGEFTNIVLGVGKADLVEPLMGVEFSKDGGITWKSKRSLKIGQSGNRQKITRSYQFGRTKKGFNFVLRFTCADNIPIFFYKVWVDLELGI